MNNFYMDIEEAKYLKDVLKEKINDLHERVRLLQKDDRQEEFSIVIRIIIKLHKLIAQIEYGKTRAPSIP